MAGRHRLTRRGGTRPAAVTGKPRQVEHARNRALDSSDGSSCTGGPHARLLSTHRVIAQGLNAYSLNAHSVSAHRFCHRT
jgi:hypothetical protein